jgi:hypothetical protein
MDGIPYLRFHSFIRYPRRVSRIRFYVSYPVLGIRDILVLIRIPGSVPLTNGSRSGSGSNSGSDSFLSDFEDAKVFFLHIFSYNLSAGTISSVQS